MVLFFAKGFLIFIAKYYGCESDMVDKFEVDTQQPPRFQDSMSSSMDSIVMFHDDVFFYLLFVTVFVLYMLLRTIFIFRVRPKNLNWFYDRMSHNVSLEII